jgi:hypothetical protein
MLRCPPIFTVALCVVCQLSYASAEPMKIQDSNVWVSAPDNCAQDKDDNLVQCRSPSGQLLANFLFMIGFPDKGKDMALYTQNNLERMALLNAQSEKPFRDFKGRVSQRIREVLTSGAILDGKVTYAFGKNEKGVCYVSATYTYANVHHIEIFSQL